MISDQLREAVKKSKMTRHAVAVAIGLDEGQMSRFMASKGGLSQEKIDRLGELLGLKIVVARKAFLKGK